LNGSRISYFFDGAAARWLHAPSPLGKELDSLADLVSFGVAPSMLLYNILSVWTGSWWIPFVALFIPAMGALRLAKFNLDDSQATEFKGLPIPANAIFWIGATAWMQSHAGEWMHAHVYWGNLIVSAVIIIVALLMVSDMRMFSLKLKNFRIGDNLLRYILIVAAVGVCGHLRCRRVRLHHNPLLPFVRLRPHPHRPGGLTL